MVDRVTLNILKNKMEIKVQGKEMSPISIILNYTYNKMIDRSMHIIWLSINILILIRKSSLYMIIAKLNKISSLKDLINNRRILYYQVMDQTLLIPSSWITSPLISWWIRTIINYSPELAKSINCWDQVATKTIIQT